MNFTSGDLCIQPVFQKCFPPRAEVQEGPRAFKAHLELSRDLENGICEAHNWSLRPLKSVPDSTLARLSGCQHHELSEDLKDCERHRMSVCGGGIFTRSNRVTWLKKLPQAWRSGFTKEQKTQSDQFGSLGCNICPISLDSCHKGGVLRVLVGQTCTSFPLRLYRGFTKASLWAPAHVRTKRSDLRLHNIQCLCPLNLAKEALFSWLHLEEPLEEENLVVQCWVNRTQLIKQHINAMVWP